ncbi:MAG: hypothetical protein NT120_02930 [Candidatus Aenigmarchaeota archaeon]|nr:hypothetical protein [Candidatus Aenigmarchaeota archaeon]
MRAGTYVKLAGAVLLTVGIAAQSADAQARHSGQRMPHANVRIVQPRAYGGNAHFLSGNAHYNNNSQAIRSFVSIGDPFFYRGGGLLWYSRLNSCYFPVAWGYRGSYLREYGSDSGLAEKYNDLLGRYEQLKEELDNHLRNEGQDMGQNTGQDNGPIDPNDRVGMHRRRAQLQNEISRQESETYVTEEPVSAREEPQVQREEARTETKTEPARETAKTYHHTARYSGRVADVQLDDVAIEYVGKVFEALKDATGEDWAAYDISEKGKIEVAVRDKDGKIVEKNGKKFLLDLKKYHNQTGPEIIAGLTDDIKEFIGKDVLDKITVDYRPYSAK